VLPDGREWTSAVGAAVLDPPRPMTGRTSVSFDSVTKVATAALGLRLVEGGRLRLDDRVSRWYRVILRSAAGESVPSAMRHELFRAPGGDGLAMQPAERPRPPRAHGYYFPRGGATPTDASDGAPYIPSRAWAGGTSTAGALAGDVPSLARWGHALLGGHILRPASLREMTRFRRGAFWTGYGLGLALSSIDQQPMWGHGGDGLGTHTEFWHLPRANLSIAVTWNDDELNEEAPFVTTLLRAALGTR
jgi:CubicO group peptidase (beta-lactamase class C family)